MNQPANPARVIMASDMSARRDRALARAARTSLRLRCMPCGLLEHGDPTPLLADYLTSADVDLVVLRSHGRGGLARGLLGSTAEHLLHTLDCDTMVVRPV